MSSSFPPPSSRISLTSEPPTLTSVLDELTRLRMRVATEDRTALLDSIRRIDRDLRAIEHAMRIGA